MNKISGSKSCSETLQAHIIIKPIHVQSLKLLIIFLMMF